MGFSGEGGRPLLPDWAGWDGQEWWGVLAGLSLQAREAAAPARASRRSLLQPEFWGVSGSLLRCLPPPPPLFLQNFLYKAIGVSLAACANKDLVQKQLQELLETARYQEEAEREVGPELVGRRGAAASRLASWPTVCSSSPRGGRERGSPGARAPSGLKEQRVGGPEGAAS